MGQPVAPVGHSMDPENLIVTSHELSVPVVVYDTSGLDDQRGVDDEDRETSVLEVMKSLRIYYKENLLGYLLL